MTSVQPVDASQSSTDTETVLKLALGTYDNTIYGIQTVLPKLDLSIDNDTDDNIVADDNDNAEHNDSDVSDTELTDSTTADNQFTTTFAVPSHLGSIKCIACDNTGTWMCSAGSDEIIKIYNLHRMIEYGALYKHTAAVNIVQFYTLDSTQDTFLLSTDLAGHLIIWSVKHWQCITIIDINSDKHSKYASTNSYITTCTVHNSGKFVICITNTGLQQIYSLLTFKCVYTHKLEKLATHIQYNTDCTRYALALIGGSIGVYDTNNELTNVYIAADTSDKIVSLLWLSNTILCTGLETGNIHVYNTAEQNNESTILNEQIHDARVRSMCLCNIDIDDNGDNVAFASCSTDGSVCICSYAFDSNTLQPIAATQSDSRLLCIAYIPPYKATVTEKSQASVLVPNTVVSKTQQRIIERQKYNHMKKLQAKKQRQLERKAANATNTVVEQPQKESVDVNDLVQQSLAPVKRVHFEDEPQQPTEPVPKQTNKKTKLLDTNEPFIATQPTQAVKATKPAVQATKTTERKQINVPSTDKLHKNQKPQDTTRRSAVTAPAVTVTADTPSVTTQQKTIQRPRKSNPKLDKFNDDSDSELPVLTTKTSAVEQLPVVDFVTNDDLKATTKKKKKHRYQH